VQAPLGQQHMALGSSGKKARSKSTRHDTADAAEDPASSVSASAPAARQLQSLRRKSDEIEAGIMQNNAAVEKIGKSLHSGEAVPKEHSEEHKVSKPKASRPCWSTEEVACSLRTATMLVIVQNMCFFLLLVPSALGECQENRTCMPLLSMVALFLDVTIFTGHLMLGYFETAYRKEFPSNNFWLLTVVWSIWNMLSHPFWRDNVLDLFVVWPQELHTILNIAAVVVCSLTQIMPSWRHLACMVMGEFFLSLALSAAEVLSAFVEALDPTALDSPTVRFDLVIFNIAILIIGSTIVLGALNPEKDIKSGDSEALSLTSALHSQAFEDDLERRKRAVLTALCDTVLTTNAYFAISASNESADRLFKRPMLHEIFTDYLKDNAEKAKFLSSMKKQFPEDDSLSDSPKRLRVTMRDAQGKLFETDVVVSDASTDLRTGKASKLMVAMHIRPEYRSQVLAEAAKRPNRWRDAGTDASAPSPNPVMAGLAGLAGDLQSMGMAIESVQVNDPLRSPPPQLKGIEEQQRLFHRDFSQELLSIYRDLLRSDTVKQSGPSPSARSSMVSKSGPPRIRLHRANYESFRRRTSFAAGLGEQQVDLRSLSFSDGETK